MKYITIDEPTMTWSDIRGGDVRLLVRRDPLGGLNHILTLMVGNRRIRSVLYPVQSGQNVSLSHNAGTSFRREWFGPGWQALGGYLATEPEPYRPEAWIVKVGNKVVMTVPVSETWPVRTPSATPPLWRRMRKAWREQVLNDADAIFGRFGYHRDEGCGWDNS